MKVLVVYYSYEGHTKQLAQAMADEVGAELLEIRPQNEMNLKGFSAYAWGGFRSLMAASPKIHPLAVDANAYDLVLVGTPVWAFTFAPPIRSFLRSARLAGKKVGLFASCEGGIGKTLPNMVRAFRGNEIVGQTYYVWRSDDDARELGAEARGWAREIVAQAK